MTPLLSIAAGVSPDVSPTDFVVASADAGWDVCGIWFDPDTWTDAVAREVRRRLDATGLVALDLEPIFVVPDGDHGTHDEGARAIEAAAAVGARNVLVVARGAAQGPFTERFAELCDLAAPHGITCAVEFMDFMSTRTLAEAIAVVEAVDRPNAGVLVDSLHLARTGSVPADLRALDPTYFPYAQLCDAPAERPENLIVEALDGRSAIGEGQLPVAELIDALPPGTPLSMEVRSKALRDGLPDPTDRARALLEPTRLFIQEMFP